MMSSKIVKGVLASLIMLYMLFAVCFAEQSENTYTDGMFSDVNKEAWYAHEVSSAYELGLMNGTSNTLFDPNGNVTVAQGITLASRIHAAQNSMDIPTVNGGNWYDGYVSYALQNGIIEESTFDSYTRPIKRSEMACLIYDGTDKDTLQAQNHVIYIPDVPGSAEYFHKLITLYNAGVVMGSDDKGTFNPDADLKRSECASIINRVASPEFRLKKELDVYYLHDAYIISEEETANNMQKGVASGWVYDNRGGAPKDSVITGNYLMIADISTEYGTAMIREFNQITSGVITTEAAYTVTGYGAFLEFRDIHDEPVYRLKLVDGNWCVLTKDGEYTQVLSNAANKAESTKFVFKIVLDLDKRIATTYINHENCGNSELLGDNLLNYRYATDEESTASVVTDYFCMTANYKAFESFTHFGLEQVYGWKDIQNADIMSKERELVLRLDAKVSKTFDKAKGDVSAQTYFILPSGGDFDFKLMSGSNEALKVYAKDSKLYFGNKQLYSLTQNMWYRLRVDYNTDSGKVKVWLNGRVVGEGTANKCDFVDEFKLTTGNNVAKFDNIRIYEVLTHDDYVPEPSAKASAEDYLVGLNVCSLWKNGEHRGWACISPYDEPRPVLGYYDEGVPESADWEIKFMTEHGIDFQSFCWYNSAQSGTPLKDPNLSDHLHEGYMYAKYSDYMKYNLIWEASNAVKFGSDMFRNYVVPYWFENYFLDERYLTVDNKLVLCIFGADTLYTSQYFGSIEAAKAEFDYLDEVAKSYGFDGFIVMANSSNLDIMASMGIDGKYAYGWGTNGKTVETNKAGMLGSVSNTNIKTIPTVSVGFDSIPWHGIRYGNMTVEDYRTTNKWVKEEFLPTYSSTDDWTDRFVMLSTWNEYGEGTYIMPAGLNGFGYLDVLREEYTNLPKEHTDHVPTFSQSRRINHLYPQYAHRLQHDGWFGDETVDASNYDSVLSYEYTKDNTETVHIDTSKITFDSNGITGVSTDGSRDPIIHMKSNAYVNVDEVTHMLLTMKAPKGSTVEVFFITENSSQWTADKSFKFSTDSDELKTYTVKITNSNFTGKLLKLRIDPVSVNNVQFTVKSFELLKPSKDEIKSVFINELEFKSEVLPDASGSKMLYPFDPAIGEAYALNLHHTWDKSNGKLKLEGNHKTVVFTVGSDKYTLDGVSKPLGYTLYLKNSLPMLDFGVLSEAFGFECETKGKCIYIKTPQYDMVANKANRIPGVWEFNDYDSEGWRSSHFSVMVSDGAMKLATVSTDHYDPIMNYENPICLDSDKYITLEMRVKYKYTNMYGTKDHVSFYYLTDKSQVWDETKSLKLSLPSTDSNDEWVTLTYNLKQNSEWRNNITSIRLDPFNALGTMEIDYIRFIEDPDYIDPDTLPFGIINGDAEDTENVRVFYSDNAKVSIVEDPDNSENHVYMVKTNAGKQWTYFRQSVKFTQGKKYKISFDLCLVSNGNGEDPGEVTFNCNFRYPDTGALNDFDHNVKSFKCKAGEWVHYEAEYYVRTMESELGHEFTIYANPVSDLGMNYMVDNVVVTEIDA